MLEDTKTALSDLDKVTVFFRQLEDECLVASKTPPAIQAVPRAIGQLCSLAE